jgi:hypothetical protein
MITLQSLQHLTKVNQKSFLQDRITGFQTQITALQAKVNAGNKEAAGALNDAVIEMAAHQYLLRQV